MQSLAFRGDIVGWNGGWSHGSRGNVRRVLQGGWYWEHGTRIDSILVDNGFGLGVRGSGGRRRDGCKDTKGRGSVGRH